MSTQCHISEDCQCKIRLHPAGDWTLQSAYGMYDWAPPPSSFSVYWKAHLISLCYIQAPYSWLTTASITSGWLMKNSSNSTGKMFSTTLMITSLARPTNRPYPSSSSTKLSLQFYQMLRVYKACITIQIMCSMPVAVTITTISAWNKHFTISLKLLRYKEISELSCHIGSPTIGN